MTRSRSPSTDLAARGPIRAGAATPGTAAHFEKLQRLGSGGMGEVHLAELVRGEHRELVALKRLHRELLDDPEALAQFRRESSTCALLSHPNVIGFRAHGEDGEGPWLALEFVFGRAASALVKARRAVGESLPLTVALAIARDVVRGLAYAHDLALPDGRVGIIHRDISPDNVLVGYDGRARLADFGIARMADATRFTHTGMARGKVGFLAPEVLDGQLADSRSDLFSLGATLFRIFTGTSAFNGRTDGELIRAVLSSPVPLASTLRDDVPAWVVGWLNRLLSKDPAARPVDLARVAGQLDRALAGEADAGAAAVARCMDESFPRDSDRVRTELTFAIQHRTRTVSQRPPQRGRRTRLVAFATAGGLLFAAAAAVLVTSLILADPAQPSPDPSRVIPLHPVAGAIPPPPAPGHARGEPPDSEASSPQPAAAPPVEPPVESPRPPAVSTSDSLMSANYPASSFDVLPDKHVFLVPSSRAARFELDPARTYRVWTEGTLAVGGMLDNILVNETLFFLQGGPRLAAKDTFGVLTTTPRLIKNASAIYAFVLDTSPFDNSGAIKVRIQDTTSRTVSNLLIDAQEHALVLEQSQRFTFGKLSEFSTYEVTVRDGEDPARTRAGRTGRVGKVVVQQHAGELTFGGGLANEIVRVFEVGKTYQVRGGQWMFFTFLDDAVEDNAGHMVVEVAPLTRPDGWIHGPNPDSEARGGSAPPPAPGGAATRKAAASSSGKNRGR